MQGKSIYYPDISNPPKLQFFRTLSVAEIEFPAIIIRNFTDACGKLLPYFG